MLTANETTNSLLGSDSCRDGKTYMEVPGIEPGASYMQSKRSTAELHPQYEFGWAYWICTF